MAEQQYEVLDKVDFETQVHVDGEQRTQRLQFKKGALNNPSDEEHKVLTSATDTFDFHKPIVKKWMEQHRMWIGTDESRLDFVARYYRDPASRWPTLSAEEARKFAASLPEATMRRVRIARREQAPDMARGG